MKTPQDIRYCVAWAQNYAVQGEVYCMVLCAGSKKMTNSEILDIAIRQSAVDASLDPCMADIFLKPDTVFIKNTAPYGSHPAARKYLEQPVPCNFISYGSNVVAVFDAPYEKIVREYVGCYSDEPYKCFETPAIHALNEALSPFDLCVCFMAEYFLPDMSLFQSGTTAVGAPAGSTPDSGIPPLDSSHDTRKSCARSATPAFELRTLTQSDFAPLYTAEWSNALCEKRRELDVLGVGAYSGGQLIGLAGASADCAGMWQIGIDVLPAFRKQGVATALVRRLAEEVLSRGKVPFYCAAWSNVKSVRTAIKTGFRPAWVELTIKPKDFAETL